MIYKLINFKLYLIMNSLTPEVLQIKIRSKESLEGLNILLNQLKNDNNVDSY